MKTLSTRRLRLLVCISFQIVLCSACAFGPSPVERLTAQDAQSYASPPLEIWIISTEFRYEPSVVRVVAGHPVMLLLDNSRGATEHGIVFPAFGKRLDARAGEITRTSFVFYAPGEYEMICDLPGHREAGMKGKLVVTR
jgi:plastocyanin